MKTKPFFIGLSLLLFLSFLPHYAFAATSPTFSLVAPGDESKVGQDIRITVKGEQLKDVYGYEIRVTYDTKKLKFKNASALWKGFSVPAILKDGEITFAHSKIGNVSGESGTVDVATLSFESIAEGDAKIELTRVKLVDSKGGASTLEPGVKTVLKLAKNNKSVHFSDIANHWAKESIERAAALGWVNGYPDGTFRPNGQVTRAEFTAMLSRALSLSSSGGLTLSFADTARIPDWAKPFVSEAVGAGVIKGYSDNTFRANNPIIRSEMTVMIMRASGISLGSGKASTFADAAQIPDWALPSVTKAVEAGLIKGKGNNRFAPGDNTTRAEAVTLILSLIDYKQGIK